MKEEIKEINLPKEIEEAFNCIDYELSVCNDELPKIKDYITNLQERNEKAIEYIKDKQELNKMFGTITLSKNSQNELLNILKGDKDE